MRHLAVGKDERTLCGLERGRLVTVHPSKATREDCPECRAEARRRKKPAVEVAPVEVAPVEVAPVEVAPVVAEAKKRNPNPSPRFRPTADEVARVKKLHREGKTLEVIETALGWPSGHGNRPWRILRNQLTAVTEEFD